MDRRRTFMLAAGSVLAVAFLLVVVRPAVERGGAQEFLIVVAIFVAILLFERYIRTR